MNDSPWRFRSPLLGSPAEVRVIGEPLEYFRRGSGPTIVFAHGWFANANLWRHVVDRLADRFDCVVLDLPLGAHRAPVSRVADLSPAGCAALIAGAIEALELRAPMLVGNDSGGAYSQIALGSRPELAAALTLFSCETPFDPFPPPPFDVLPKIATNLDAFARTVAALEDRNARRAKLAFGLLAKRPIPDDVSDSYALPCLHDRGVLENACRAISSASPEPVRLAGERLARQSQTPIVLAWSIEDPVFPIAHAERYAQMLPRARVERISDAFSFTPEDRPEEVARIIATAHEPFLDTRARPMLP